MPISNYSGNFSISNQKFPSQSEVASFFWNAPDNALFTQQQLSQILNFSPAWFEKMRWAGSGVPYLKLGRAIRYRKADVLAWLDQQNIISSTSEFGGKNA